MCGGPFYFTPVFTTLAGRDRWVNTLQRDPASPVILSAWLHKPCDHCLVPAASVNDPTLLIGNWRDPIPLRESGRDPKKHDRSLQQCADYPKPLLLASHMQLRVIGDPEDPFCALQSVRVRGPCNHPQMANITVGPASSSAGPGSSQDRQCIHNESRGAVDYIGKEAGVIDYAGKAAEDSAPPFGGRNLSEGKSTTDDGTGGSGTKHGGDDERITPGVRNDLDDVLSVMAHIEEKFDSRPTESEKGADRRKLMILIHNLLVRSSARERVSTREMIHVLSTHQHSSSVARQDELACEARLVFPRQSDLGFPKPFDSGAIDRVLRGLESGVQWWPMTEDEAMVVFYIFRSEILNTDVLAHFKLAGKWKVIPADLQTSIRTKMSLWEFLSVFRVRGNRAPAKAPVVQAGTVASPQVDEDAPLVLPGVPKSLQMRIAENDSAPWGDWKLDFHGWHPGTRSCAGFFVRRPPKPSKFNCPLYNVDNLDIRPVVWYLWKLLWLHVWRPSNVHLLEQPSPPPGLLRGAAVGRQCKFFQAQIRSLVIGVGLEGHSAPAFEQDFLKSDSLFAKHGKHDQPILRAILLRAICFLRSEAAAFVIEGGSTVYIHHRFIEIRQLLLSMGHRIAVTVFGGHQKVAEFVRFPQSVFFFDGDGGEGPFGARSAMQNVYLLRDLQFRIAGTINPPVEDAENPELVGDVRGVPDEVRPQSFASIREAVDGTSDVDDGSGMTDVDDELPVESKGQLPGYTLPSLLLEEGGTAWGPYTAPVTAVNNRMSDPAPFSKFRGPPKGEPELDLFPVLAPRKGMDEGQILMLDMRDPHFDYTRLGDQEGGDVGVPIRPMWDPSHPMNTKMGDLLIEDADCKKLQRKFTELVRDPKGKLQSHPIPKTDFVKHASVTQLLVNYTLRLAECQGSNLLSEAEKNCENVISYNLVYTSRFIFLIRCVFLQGAAGTGKGFAVDLFWNRMVKSRKSGIKMVRTGGTLSATFVIRGTFSTIYTFGLNCRSLVTQLERLLVMFPYDDGISEYTLILDEYTVNAGTGMARLLGGLYEFNMMMFQKYGFKGLSVFILVFAGDEGQLGGVQVVNLPESSLVKPVAMKSLSERKQTPQSFPKSKAGESGEDEKAESFGDEGEDGELEPGGKRRYATVAHVFWWIQQVGLSIRLISQQRTKDDSRKGRHLRMHQLHSCALNELRQNFYCSLLGQQIIKDACSKESALRRWRRQYREKHPGATPAEVEAYARDSLVYMELKVDDKREMPIAVAHPNRDCTAFHSSFLRHTEHPSVISVLSASVKTSTRTNPAATMSPSDQSRSSGSDMEIRVNSSVGSGSPSTVVDMCDVSSRGSSSQGSSPSSGPHLSVKPSLRRRLYPRGDPASSQDESEIASPSGVSCGSESPSSGARLGGGPLGNRIGDDVLPMLRGSPLSSHGSSHGASAVSNDDGDTFDSLGVPSSPPGAAVGQGGNMELSSNDGSLSNVSRELIGLGGVKQVDGPYGSLKGDGSVHLAALLLHRLRTQEFPEGGLYNGASCVPVWYFWNSQRLPPHPPMYTLIYLGAWLGPPLLHADLLVKLKTDDRFKPVRDFFLMRREPQHNFYDKLVLVRSTTSGHRSLTGLQVTTQHSHHTLPTNSMLPTTHKTRNN